MYFDTNYNYESSRYKSPYSMNQSSRPKLIPKPRVRIGFSDIYEFQYKKLGKNIYKCRACNILYLSASNVKSHSTENKHITNLERLKDAKRQKLKRQSELNTHFRKQKKYHSKEVPYPPGKKVSNFEKIVDSIQEPLVALEYFIEVTEDSKGQSYICTLCDMKFNTIGLKNHLVSQKHRFQNLKRHFPTLVAHLKTSRQFVEDSEFRTEVLKRISSKIESEYGIGTGFFYEGTNFKRMEPEIYEFINNKEHITVKDFPDAERYFLRGIDLFNKQWLYDNPYKEPQNEVPNINDSKRRYLPETVVEEYLSAVLTTTKEFQTKLRNYELCPDSHPYYKEEWKMFWKGKTDELVERGEDPTKYNFDDEWYKFFHKRIYEIHEEELGKKVLLIQKRFGLSKEEVDEIKNTPATKKIRLDSEEIDKPNMNIDEVHSISHKTRVDKQNTDSKKIQWAPKKDDTKEKVSYSSDVQMNETKKTTSKPEKSSQLSNDPTNLVKTCRLLVSLETELGLLASKVLDLLSKSIAYERNESKSSNELLFENENLILIETVKEKLIGMQLTNLVAKNRTKAVETALNELNKLIEHHELMEKVKKTLQGMQKNEVTPEEIALLKTMFSK